jgi:nicotinate phosphoribosyltransferase
MTIDDHLGIATDLYQLTMAAAMHEDGSADDLATYNLFIRKLPKGRDYLVAAGLEQAIHYLQNVCFSEEDIAYLKSQPVFRDSAVSEGFWDRLRNFKFTGELRAVPEGTLIFGNEPILSITAPRIQAQIIETYLLGIINSQTNAATKAALIVDAAQGRPVFEFGFRRVHPAGHADIARAAYIGGCVSTSNVLAGRTYGIPITGTMAHAYVMSKDAEEQAYADYAKTFPNHTVGLIDTYDPIRGTEKAIAMAGKRLKGVRTDSGTLEQMAEDTKRMRKMLDDAGLKDTRIIASNDLNEEKIRRLLELGAPIDAFGVGTELAAVKDHPALGCVYKLVEDKNGPKMKLSADKASYPGRQQVWRLESEYGTHGAVPVFLGDVIALEGETLTGRTPLLKTYLRGGQLVEQLPDLGSIRATATVQRYTLQNGLRACRQENYPVTISPGLEKLVNELKAKHGGN